MPPALEELTWPTTAHVNALEDTVKNLQAQHVSQLQGLETKMQSLEAQLNELKHRPRETVSSNSSEHGSTTKRPEPPMYLSLDARSENISLDAPSENKIQAALDLISPYLDPATRALVSEAIANASDKKSPDGGDRPDSAGLPPRDEDDEAGEYTPRRNMTLIMIALMVTSFLAILDISFVTTALPTIAAHFKASQISYSWVGSAYLVTQSALAPLWGKVSDIFGRKPIMLLATLVFFLGSLMCGVASNIAVLIAGRAVQGAGAGGVLLIVSILIGDLVSPRQRGLYFGILGVTYAIAISSGPIIGGVIAENIGWRWCFYINLPFQGVSFALLVFFLHVHNPRTEIIKGLMAVDWLGSIALTGSVVMLLLGLQYGGEVHPWGSAIVVCLILFGVVICGLFVGIEWKLARYPVLPLRLFTKVPIIALFVVDLTHGFLLYGTAYFVPFYFQIVTGASPIDSAVWSLPLAIPLALFTIGTGLYMRTTGKYFWMIVGGMVLTTLGTGLLIDFSAEKNWPKIIIYQLIIAVGLGPNFQAPTIALQARFPAADAGVAVSAASAIRALSAAFSIVLGGVILENRLSTQTGNILASGVSREMADAIAKGGAAGSVELIKQLTPAQQYVFRVAVKDSLADMWIFFVVLSGIGLIASFFVGSDELSDEHVEHKTGLEVEEQNRLVYKKQKLPEPGVEMT